MEAWAGCVAGALEENDYLARLAAAGFTDAGIEMTQTYDVNDALGCCGSSRVTDSGSVISGFIRARKPE
jgi:hypothetical protein